MDNEIKEILDNPKILMLSYGNYISLDDYVKLKDYITNLQEENKEIKKSNLILIDYQDMEQRLKEVSEENQKLVKVIDELRTFLKNNAYWVVEIGAHRNIPYIEVEKILNKLNELKGGSENE